MVTEIEFFDKAIHLCATGLVSVIATSALGYIRSISRSITDLNLSVARLLERSVLLEKALDLLSHRLEKLEQKGREKDE